MVDTTAKNRTTFFVDGFNLFHSVKEAEKKLPGRQLKWLNIPQLCRSYLHLIGGNAELVDVHYFTAFADHLRDKNSAKVQKHRAFVRALTASGVTAHIGHFRKRKIWSYESEQWVKAYEEKETDVAIACKVLTLALEDRLDVAVIITGDSDFAPVYRCFKSHFPKKRLLFAFPFARVSKELKRLCPDSFTISKEAYAKHQLPENVKLPSGKHVTIPDNWREDS
ncbi:MAG: NYN domain-containing protein [Verrucomicrobia bacterium]|nr:NYN domain-containing protein [Verrucomicrobiota bacterium]